MKATDFQPLGRYVLVRPDPDERTRDSGLIIPKWESHQPRLGTVVSPGEGFIAEKTGVRVPPSVAAGDRVVYLHFAGHEVEIDGVKHRMVKDEDIYAVIENGAA